MCAFVVLQLLDFDHRDWMDGPTGALLLIISSHFLQFPYCATIAEQSAELGVDGSPAPQDVRSLSLSCSSNWRQRKH